MAYAPIPNIVTIHAPKMNCNQLSMNALSEVLQSNSVKRLLNRQNVYLHAPLLDESTTSSVTPTKNATWEKRNGSSDSKTGGEKLPDLSVIPIMNFDSKDESSDAEIEDKHLLPSKTEGKSAVALLPLKLENRKCGHEEPCENIICNVEFQQLIDGDSALPLVAVNIESHEIDAPVSKHCDDDKCDALSIDHDRCRRAVIRCHRCDNQNNCDVCLTVLKTRKSRLMHKNCKMRVEYRHNKTSRGQLMRDRMRVRELQILDAAKLKKNYYNDPTTEHERAIESLQRNSELIVIPKTCLSVQQHPTIRITSVTGGGTPSNVYTGDTLNKLIARYPLVFSGRKMLVAKPTDSTESSTPTKPAAQSAGKFFSTIGPQPNQFIAIPRPANLSQPIELGDYLKAKGTAQANPTSYFMPIRVVPIAGLKTQPSMLHQSQGVPKFCLVSQSPNHSATFAKVPPKILPAQQPNERTLVKLQPAIKNARKAEICGEFVLKRFKSGMRRGRRKKNGPKRGSKSFECTFCFKRFSTDWYFKLHIAKHKGEIKFTCKFCKKPFMHHYNMTKHIVTMHKGEYGSDDLASEENGESLHCSSCKVTFETANEKDSHRCPVVCLRCYAKIDDGDLTLHLKTRHSMPEDKALEEFVRQKRQRIIIEQNRERKRHEMEKEQAARRTKIKEEPKVRIAERENGTPKRKRSSLNSSEEREGKDDGSNDQISTKIPLRRLTRRRKQNLSNQVEDVSTNKNINETLEDESTDEYILPSIVDKTELISR